MTYGIAFSRAQRTAGVVLLGLLLLVGRQAWGQAAAGTYKIIDVPPKLLDGSPEEDKKLKMDLEREMTTVLRGDVSLDDPAVRARFDGYLTRYYFAILTHPAHLGEWVSRREDFLDRRLPLAKLDRVHDHAVNLVRTMMEGIVKDNYHPVARHNAMLVLGALNSKEAVMVGDAKRPPAPLLPALRVMLDELSNPNQIDAVRVAALVGILRHVRVDREQPTARQLVGNSAETMITTAMIDLLNATEPPEGRTAEGHAWMQRRAADILGTLGVGKAEVVTTLAAVVGNDQAPLALRRSAADALGRLNYPQDANLNPVEVGKKLGAVAAETCYREIARVEQQEARENIRKGLPPEGLPTSTLGGYPGGGMFGPAMTGKLAGGGPLAYRIDLTRRQVKSGLVQVRRGLAGDESVQTAGLAGLAKPNNGEKEVNDLVAAVDAIISVTDDSSFKDLKALITEIRSKVRKMEDDCGIVLAADDEAAAGADALLNPLEAGLPEIPTGPPADEALPGPPPPGAEPPAGGVPAPPAPGPQPPAAGPPAPGVPPPPEGAPPVPPEAVPDLPEVQPVEQLEPAPEPPAAPVVPLPPGPEPPQP